MSKAATSPTARLLQTSRLFSLPTRLPPSPLEGITSTGIFRASDTATSPYPTYQAITTPQSSLRRGDFGLKRALPAKTTRRTSNPHIRVKAQDTVEHVTEFESAADHTLSRQKWLAMGVPFVKRRSRREEVRGDGKAMESVFEDYLDNTDAAALTQGERSPGLRMGREPTFQPKQRWKYNVWMAGMQPGEFEPWMHEHVATRRAEWKAFLREQEMQAQLQRAQLRARDDAGTPLSAKQVEELKPSLVPSDEQLARIEKALRDDHVANGLSSRLSQLIVEWLDLPPMTDTPSSSAVTRKFSAAVDTVMSDHGPPTTHPSAGLGYLRSNAVMENHPLFGPQKHRSPVEARVVRPRFQQTGFTEHTAKLGVGGFVASDPISSTFTQATLKTMPEPDRMASQLDPDLEGGNKMWVHPESAFVDEKGQVQMALSRAEPEALAVRKGEVEHIHEAKRAGLAGPTRMGGQGVRAETSRAPRPQMQGFDDLLGGGNGGEEREADWMRRQLEQERRPRT